MLLAGTRIFGSARTTGRVILFTRVLHRRVTRGQRTALRAKGVDFSHPFSSAPQRRCSVSVRPTTFYRHDLVVERRVTRRRLPRRSGSLAVNFCKPSFRRRADSAESFARRRFYHPLVPNPRPRFRHKCVH